MFKDFACVKFCVNRSRASRVLFFTAVCRDGDARIVLYRRSGLGSDIKVTPVYPFQIIDRYKRWFLCVVYLLYLFMVVLTVTLV